MSTFPFVYDLDVSLPGGEMLPEARVCLPDATYYSGSNMLLRRSSEIRFRTTDEDGTRSRAGAASELVAAEHSMHLES